MHLGLAASLLLLIALPLAAQGTDVRFEVASVKSNPQRSGVRGHSYPGDRFEARNVPARDLILVAYGEPGDLLPDIRLSGGPDWIDSARFDVSATTGSGGPSSVAVKQAMLRNLLSERFNLVVRRELRKLPTYAMRISRANGALGPRLQRAEVECEPLLASQPGRRERCILAALPSGQLVLRGQTMGALANVLTMLLGRFVTDMTGLIGGFDADAQFSPEGLPGVSPGPPGNQPQNDAPSLINALQEQLGLKLESTRGPVEVIVIERIERPSDN